MQLVTGEATKQPQVCFRTQHSIPGLWAWSLRQRVSPQQCRVPVEPSGRPREQVQAEKRFVLSTLRQPLPVIMSSKCKLALMGVGNKHTHKYSCLSSPSPQRTHAHTPCIPKSNANGIFNYLPDLGYPRLWPRALMPITGS